MKSLILCNRIRGLLGIWLQKIIKYIFWIEEQLARLKYSRRHSFGASEWHQRKVGPPTERVHRLYGGSVRTFSHSTCQGQLYLMSSAVKIISSWSFGRSHASTFTTVKLCGKAISQWPWSRQFHFQKIRFLPPNSLLLISLGPLDSLFCLQTL